MNEILHMIIFFFRAKNSDMTHFQHKFYRQMDQCLYYMYNQAIACDMTLLVQGQTIRCHKVIMSVHSTVLHEKCIVQKYNSVTMDDDVKYEAIKKIIG